MKTLYPSHHWIISHCWFKNLPQSACQPCSNDDFNHSGSWEDQWSTTLNGSVTKLEPVHKQCVGGQHFHLNTRLRKRSGVLQSHQAICRNGYGGGITSVMFVSCCYCRLFQRLLEGEKWCHVATGFLFHSSVYNHIFFLPSKILLISVFHRLPDSWGALRGLVGAVAVCQ